MNIVEDFKQQDTSHLKSVYAQDQKGFPQH